MPNALKVFLKRSSFLVALHRTLANARYNLRDLFDTFLSMTALPKRKTSRYGFSFRAGSSRAHLAIKEGRFETEEIALIQSRLTPIDLFVDVGANIGLYTCLSRSAGKQTLAIEPQAKNLRLLYENLLENGYRDVEVYPLGLSDQPGVGLLYGASGTGASLIKGWAGQPRWYRSTIPLTTLDILLGNRFKGKKLLIKIDVEGAELAVLRGAEKTAAMSPRPTWIIEICFNEYHPSGLNPDYIPTFKFFWERGYEARTADQRSLLIQPSDVDRWARTGKCDSGVINYLFTSAS